MEAVFLAIENARDEGLHLLGALTLCGLVLFGARIVLRYFAFSGYRK